LDPLGRKRGLQPATPRQAQFGADMNDSHASLDRADEILVVGSRAATAFSPTRSETLK